MTGIMSWRALATFATVDALLILTTTSAWAASAAEKLAGSGSALPTLLVAIGLVGVPLIRGERH